MSSVNKLIYKAESNGELYNDQGIRSTDVQGKMAILTEEVLFYTHSHLSVGSGKKYPKGTKVKASYRMTITDLFAFEFPCGNIFVLRPRRFEWIKNKGGK